MLDFDGNPYHITLEWGLRLRLGGNTAMLHMEGCALLDVCLLITILRYQRQLAEVCIQLSAVLVYRLDTFTDEVCMGVDNVITM